MSGTAAACRLQRRWITWDELQNGEADRDVCMQNYSLQRHSACRREEVRLTSRCARGQSAPAQRTGSQGGPCRRVAGVRAGAATATDGSRGGEAGSVPPTNCLPTQLCQNDILYYFCAACDNTGQGRDRVLAVDVPASPRQLHWLPIGLPACISSVEICLPQSD